MVAPLTLVFDASNWDTPQIATVTGQDDAVVDGDIAFSIVTSPAVSNDSAYSGVDADDVAVINEDDDVVVLRPVSLGQKSAPHFPRRTLRPSWRSR